MSDTSDSLLAALTRLGEAIASVLVGMGLMKAADEAKESKANADALAAVAKSDATARNQSLDDKLRYLKQRGLLPDVPNPPVPPKS